MTSAVVVPVRDGAALIVPALEALLSEFEPHLIIVVDDGSRDASAAIAAARGATVLVGAGVGPYAARNDGWRHAAVSGVELVLFSDVRCRVRPGWREAMEAAAARGGGALFGGETITSPGTSHAARHAAAVQPLAMRHGLERPFLPFFPTANLAVTAAALAAVDGFAVAASGGDLDLCWRVQLAGLGGCVAVPDAIVDWVPRSTMGSYLTNCRKYGAAAPAVTTRFAAAGAPTTAPPGWPAYVASEARHIARELVRHTVPASVVPVGVLARLASRSGQLASWRAMQKQSAARRSP